MSQLSNESEEGHRNKRPRSNSNTNTNININTNANIGSGYGTYGHYGGSGKLPSTARKERFQMLLQESKNQESESVGVTADNIGHTMLKGMGWAEGKGLGSTGSGIQTPVSVVSRKGRSGIGTGTGTGASTR